MTPSASQVIPTAGEMVPFTAMMEDFAGRRPPLPRPRPGAPLPGPGADARHHPVRLLLPLLHPLAHRRRPGANLLARTSSTCRSSTSSAPRRCAMCCSPAATRWCWRPSILEEILTRLREIPHIEIVRIGSRVPVFMPMRITAGAVRHARQVPSVVDEHPRQPLQRDQPASWPRPATA